MTNSVTKEEVDYTLNCFVAFDRGASFFSDFIGKLAGVQTFVKLS
jgi:hypothetical protein